MARRIATLVIAAVWSATICAEAGASEYPRNPYLSYSCKDLALAATNIAKRAEEDIGIRRDALPNNAAGEPAISWPKAFSENVSGEKASDVSHLKKETTRSSKPRFKVSVKSYSRGHVRLAPKRGLGTRSPTKGLARPISSISSPQFLAAAWLPRRISRAGPLRGPYC